MREYSKSQIRDIIGWDIAAWSRAVHLWDEVIPDHDASGVALELGAGKGGVSLYLALHGYQTTCSDVVSPETASNHMHEHHAVTKLMTYRAVNALAMPFTDASFDVIAFKSVLGGIGKLDPLNIDRAIAEILRVLKPGGLLLFAENLAGSSLHMFFRRRFVRWGKSWYYLELDELREKLCRFSDYRLETAGLLSAFGRSEWQRSCLQALDRIAEPLVGEKKRYVTFGWARK